MSRRRLRICAAGALLALTAPVFAGQAPSSNAYQNGAQIRAQAQHFGHEVRDNSIELSQRLATGARQAGRQINVGMHQFSQSVQQWWAGLRSSPAHASIAPGQHAV